MDYGLAPRTPVGCCLGGITPDQPKGTAMNILKSQTFRIVMLLSALASSSLVLMAARRWF